MKDQTLTLQAHAKVNLFLDMTGKRADGYHTITGVMHSIGLWDDVIVSLSPKGDGKTPITLTCSHPDLPTDNKNLGYRGVEAFWKALGCLEAPPCAVHIHIEKRIPAAAGMAGGSTDAAAVLKGLNILMGEPLDMDTLCAVGLTLGADVPFCIKGGTQMTQGVGEVLTPVSPLPPCYMVVSCGGEGVSTPKAYHALDGMYANFDGSLYTPQEERLTALCHALDMGDMVGVCQNAYNIFEDVVLPQHEVASGIKNTMYRCGASLSLMSGSGPSVFGIFETPKEAQNAVDALRDQGVWAWLCQ